MKMTFKYSVGWGGHGITVWHIHQVDDHGARVKHLANLWKRANDTYYLVGHLPSPHTLPRKEEIAATDDEAAKQLAAVILRLD